MRYAKRLALCLAALAAPAATPWPAAAQCRLCDSPTLARPDQDRDSDVTLEVEAGIDFDRIILWGAGQGTAVLRPDGTSLAQGAVAEVGPRAMVGTALIQGQAGRVVRVDLPRRISLRSPNGAEITVDDVSSDLPAVPRLDAAGRLRFRFGGRLTIQGDAEGQFRGDLPITVEYP